MMQSTSPTFLLTKGTQQWWGEVARMVGSILGREKTGREFLYQLTAAKGAFCNVHHGSHFSDTTFDLLTPLKSC